MLRGIQKIEIQDITELVAKQLKNLISSGELSPGDKLPSERILSEKLGVSRGYVRDAIKKLEILGLLKTYPQKGTFIEKSVTPALEAFLEHMIDIEKSSFIDLIETRTILEQEAAYLAAQRATKEDIEKIMTTLANYKEAIKEDSNAIEEDLKFHRAIAESTHNSLLVSFINVIIPNIMTIYRANNICEKDELKDTYSEHLIIANYIKEGKSDEVKQAVKKHLEKVVAFGKRFSKEK